MSKERRYVKRSMTEEQALDVIRAFGGRTAGTNFQLKFHRNARSGGTSILVKHDDHHGLSEITRTLKRSNYSYEHGVVTWSFDDDKEKEYEDWTSVLIKIAERIKAGYYEVTP